MDLSLEVDSVLHRFGGITILTDVYLKCERGDIVGLFGRNGTGKTTLFRIIFGELKADRSFVRIDGRVIKGRAMSTGLITYVPQFNYLPERMKVKNIVHLSISKKDEFYNDFFYKRAHQIRICELPEGEKRYLEIMLALRSDTPYVILDEPFKAMSPLMIERLQKEIKAVSNNKGIILTDHRYQDVCKIANKYMLLKDTYLFPIARQTDLAKHGYYNAIANNSKNTL